MKSILIAIRPQWVEKIASGKKTIEVRRSAPKEVPFKCYIYETKGQYVKFTHGALTKYGYGRGKVIGEFICDKIYKWECKNRLEILESFPIWRASYMLFVDDLEKTCLTYDDLWDYGKGKTLYGLHISDLKIYDKPRELSEFFVRKFDNRDYCSGCVHHETPITEYPCNECRRDAFERQYLYRPPQSWQYVEEL